MTTHSRARFDSNPVLNRPIGPYAPFDMNAHAAPAGSSRRSRGRDVRAPLRCLGQGRQRPGPPLGAWADAGPDVYSGEAGCG